MKKLLAITIISYCLLVYWAEFHVKNPVHEDLKYLCEIKLNQQELLKASNKLVSVQLKATLPYLKKISLEQRVELMMDFSRSRGMSWNCKI